MHSNSLKYTGFPAFFNVNLKKTLLILKWKPTVKYY
ncbi:hypothetical protein NIASO_09365 [Niabella soli DSM 19437]|uniref:Uncharacterized protein n=1 Tax=Niabella soli DSM 19437 TaxID=929713 RepID=W0F7U6_9BACT|nr:hypothetical protein NIASO_09365 [Niabella soli DSM 19437]